MCIRMYVYVYIYVIYVCTYVCMYVYLFVCMYVCVSMFVCTYTHTHTHTHIYIYIYIYISIYKLVHKFLALRPRWTKSFLATSNICGIFKWFLRLFKNLCIGLYVHGVSARRWGFDRRREDFGIQVSNISLLFCSLL